MSFSAEAERAFDDAIEAAYVMQEIEDLWGRECKELGEAFEDYKRAVARYYAITGGARERFWEEFCQRDPFCIECRMYEV